WVRARVRGEPGHGSMPREDSAVVKLAAGITRLARGLPPHRTAVVRDFLGAIASAQPAALRPLLAAALDTRVLARLVKRLPDAAVGRALGAMLANTASPTVVRAGSKTNV